MPWPISDDEPRPLQYLIVELNRLSTTVGLVAALRYARYWRRLADRIQEREKSGSLPDLPVFDKDAPPESIAEALEGAMEFLHREFADERDFGADEGDVLDALDRNEHSDAWLKTPMEMVVDLSSSDIDDLLAKWEPELNDLYRRMSSEFGDDTKLQLRKFWGEFALEKGRIAAKGAGESVTRMRQDLATRMGYEDPTSLERFFRTSKKANGGLNLVDRRLVPKEIGDLPAWNRTVGRAFGIIAAQLDKTERPRGLKLPWEKRAEQDRALEKRSVAAATKLGKLVFGWIKRANGQPEEAAPQTTPPPPTTEQRRSEFSVAMEEVARWIAADATLRDRMIGALSSEAGIPQSSASEWVEKIFITSQEPR